MVTIIGNSDVVGHHWCFSDNNSAKSCHKPWIRNFAWLMMSGVIHEFYMVRNWAFFWLKSHWENTKVMFVSKTIFLFKWTFLQYFGKIKWFDIWVSEGITRLLRSRSFHRWVSLKPWKYTLGNVEWRVRIFRDNYRIWVFSQGHFGSMHKTWSVLIRAKLGIFWLEQ